MDVDWGKIFRVLVFPLLSAQLFMLFLGYFVVVKKQISRHYHFYIYFLLGLLFYVILRPVQSFYPMHLFCRYTRTLVLFSVAAPALIIAACEQCCFHLSTHKKVLIFVCGVLFGLAYALSFDLLRVENGFFAWCGISSEDVFAILPAYVVSSYMYQLIGSIVLFLIPSTALVCNELFFRRDARIKPFVIGTFIFGVSFVVGTWTTSWWIYYVGAFASAPFWAWTIYRDIVHMKSKAESFAPLIREELLQSISTYSSDGAKLTQLFNAAEISHLPTRFLVIRPKVGTIDSHDQIEMLETINNVVTRVLQQHLGDKSYLVMETGTSHLAVCLHDSNEDSSWVIEFSEAVREEIARQADTEISIGLGGLYSSIDTLYRSYNEAFDVSQYLARTGQYTVLAYSDIHQETTYIDYPFHQRNAVMEMVRSGKAEAIPKTMAALCTALMMMCRDDLNSFKENCNDVVFILIDTVLQAGIKRSQVTRWNRIIDECASKQDIESVMIEKSIELVELIAAIPEVRKADSILKAKSFIEEQYQRDFGVEEVAEHVGLSRSYFMSTFKKQMGVTVNQYIIQTRIEKAKVLLLTKSITDTAFAVGYNNSNYFSKVFKKQTGTTPSEFQQSKK